MPIIGDYVTVQWMDLAHGGLSREHGRLNVVTNEEGKITYIVVESDGGAAFIERSLVVSVQ